uniref:Uncharacterized protein n=1 Tax=Marseillevirus LCMAC101 TaxID=2506602 RepID=A0A481YTE4_9VIRU|nr:MAG: hypothetical protein LCMAC101_07760 [Marseillevirus LCMAC101]
MSIKIIENRGIDSSSEWYKNSVFGISDGNPLFYKCIFCQEKIPNGKTAIACYCHWGELFMYCENCALKDPNADGKYCIEFCDVRTLPTNSNKKMHKLLNYAEVLKQLIHDGSTFEIDGIAYTATSTANIKKAK